MEKRTVVIYVANQRFALATEDSDEYVIEVGEKVDVMMKGVSNTNPRLNRDGVATLCALSLCDDLTKLERKQEELREEIKAYLKDAKALREENEALKAKIEELELKKEALPTPEEVNPKAYEADAVKTSPASEEVKPTPVVEKEPQPEQKRQLAFAGKDFKSDRKKRHDHEAKRQRQKPWMQTPSEEKTKEVTATADDEEDRGLPEEPPLQYSIFDTDFI